MQLPTKVFLCILLIVFIAYNSYLSCYAQIPASHTRKRLPISPKAFFWTSVGLQLLLILATAYGIEQLPRTYAWGASTIVLLITFIVIDTTLTLGHTQFAGDA